MNRFIIFFLFLTTHGFCQLTQEELVSTAIGELGISVSNVSEELLTSRSFGAQTLLVIPVRSQKGEGFIKYDAHVVLIETQTGKLIGHFFGKDEWLSDAVFLSQISIDPTLYHLGSSKEAYGIRINYRNNSRYYPFSKTEFSFFEKEGSHLKQILENYEVSLYRGETDTDCNAGIEIHKNTFEITEAETNGYADLEFTNVVERSVSTDQNCELEIKERIEIREVLKFRNGGYCK